jgi:serine/threonine protein kinase
MSRNESTDSESSCATSLSSEGVDGWCELNEGDCLNNDSYVILEKLGEGRFSSVWECKNKKDGNLYAVKVKRNTKNYSELADEEIKLYEKMNGPLENVLTYHGNFVHNQEGGVDHQCIVFDAMDTTLVELVEEDKIIPLDLIKDITRQILTGVKNLHEVGIIHTDLKPENILVKWEGKNIQIAIADLGSGCETDNVEIYSFGTREYRSPEAILETKFDASTDIWSVGCIVFELITGDYLFDPHKYYDDSENTYGRSDSMDSIEDREYELDHMHLHTMISILGEVPRRVSKGSELFKDHFNRDGTIKNKKLNKTTIKSRLIEEYGLKEKLASEIENFLLKIFHYRRHERATAEQLLNHPFLKK